MNGTDLVVHGKPRKCAHGSVGLREGRQGWGGPKSCKANKRCVGRLWAARQVLVKRI